MSTILEFLYQNEKGNLAIVSLGKNGSSFTKGNSRVTRGAFFKSYGFEIARTEGYKLIGVL